MTASPPLAVRPSTLASTTPPNMVSTSPMFDDLMSAGSMAEAKARGRVRIEGKDYVMADGDVVEFRFNV